MVVKPVPLVEVKAVDGLIGLSQAAHFGGPLQSARTVIQDELRQHNQPPDRTFARARARPAWKASVG